MCISRFGFCQVLYMHPFHVQGSFLAKIRVRHRIKANIKKNTNSLSDACPLGMAWKTIFPSKHNPTDFTMIYGFFLLYYSKLLVYDRNGIGKINPPVVYHFL